MTRRLVFSYLSLMLLVLLALEVPFGFVYARGELSRQESSGAERAACAPGSHSGSAERSAWALTARLRMNSRSDSRFR